MNTYAEQGLACVEQALRDIAVRYNASVTRGPNTLSLTPLEVTQGLASARIDVEGFDIDSVRVSTGWIIDAVITAVSIDRGQPSAAVAMIEGIMRGQAEECALGAAEAWIANSWRVWHDWGEWAGGPDTEFEHRLVRRLSPWRP